MGGKRKHLLKGCLGTQKGTRRLAGKVGTSKKSARKWGFGTYGEIREKGGPETECMEGKLLGLLGQNVPSTKTRKNSQGCERTDGMAGSPGRGWGLVKLKKNVGRMAVVAKGTQVKPNVRKPQRIGGFIEGGNIINKKNRQKGGEEMVQKFNQTNLGCGGSLLGGGNTL